METPWKFNPALAMPIPTNDLIRLDGVCEIFESWLRETEPGSTLEISKHLSTLLINALSEGIEGSEEAFRLRFLQETLPIAWEWEAGQGRAVDATPYQGLGEVVVSIFTFWKANSCSESNSLKDELSVKPLSDSYALSQTREAIRELVALSGRSGEVLWRTVVPPSMFALASQDVPYHYRWFTGVNTGSSEGGSGTYFNQGYWTRDSNQSCELTGEFVAVGALIFPEQLQVGDFEASHFGYQAGELFVQVDLKSGRFTEEAVSLGGIPLMPPVLWPANQEGATTLYWIDKPNLQTTQSTGPNGAQPILRCVAWDVTEKRMRWQKAVVAHLPHLRTWEMTLPRWPYLVDLDGDQSPEWIVPDRSSSGATGNPKSTSLKVIDSRDGVDKWVAEIRHADTQIDYWLVGPDRDGDQVLDVYTTTMAGLPARVHLDVLSGFNGRAILRGHSLISNRDSPATFYLNSPVLWGVGNDGWPKVVVPLQSTHSREGDGTELKIFSTQTGQCEQEATHVHKVETGDLNGDQIPDLVLSRYRTPELGLRGQSESHFVRGIGNGLWDRLGNPLHQVSDLNGDGVSDVIEIDYRSITARDSLDGSELWRFSLSGRASHTVVHSERGVAPIPATGTQSRGTAGPMIYEAGLWDFDSDGINDLVIESHTGGSKLEVLQAISGKTGRRIWTTRESKTYQQGKGVLQSLDINGDGAGELIYLAYTDVLLQSKSRRSWSGDDGHLVLSVFDSRTGQERWHRVLSREYGSNPIAVEVQRKGESESPRIVLHTRGEYPQVQAFDADSGKRMWWSYGPTRHRSYSSDIASTQFIQRPNGSPPIVVYNNIDQSSARFATQEEGQLKRLEVPVLTGRDERDIRFQRALPWMQNSMMTESPIEVLAFLATGLLQSLLLVWIPGGYVYATLRKGAWSLRSLLMLPVVIAFVLIVLKLQESEASSSWLASFGLGLVFAPLSGLLGALVQRCVQMRWRDVLRILQVIVSGALFTVTLALGGRFWSEPLDRGEYYDWSGWYWILPHSLFLSAYLYWGWRMVQWLFQKKVVSSQ